jgi:ATP-binding cassette subfamily C protein CydC
LSKTKVLDQKKISSDIYSKITDNIFGLQDYILADRKNFLVRQTKNDFDELWDIKDSSQRFGWIRDFIIQVAVLVSVIFTLIWASSHFTDKMGLNFIVAFSLTILTTVDILIAINQGVTETSFYFDSSKRLNQLQTNPSDDNKKTVQLNPNYFSQIKISNLSFSYQKRIILKNLNLTVNKGEKIALLGKSGAGKTTLLSLINGELPATDGSVKINGIPVENLETQKSDLIAYLDQSAYLFNMTVKDNLLLARPNARDSQLKSALKTAGLDKFIASLPEGLNTQINESGDRLSGGERQRLALARVVLSRAPIVILDEPTVSLDPKTEVEVLKSIFSALDNRTIIWVTHHLTGINNVDKVYFIEDGEFQMTGSPLELEKSSPRFKALVNFDKGI